MLKLKCPEEEGVGKVARPRGAGLNQSSEESEAPQMLARAGDGARRDSVTCREKTDRSLAWGRDRAKAWSSCYKDLSSGTPALWTFLSICPVCPLYDFTSAAVKGTVAKNTTGFCPCHKIYLKLKTFG